MSRFEKWFLLVATALTALTGVGLYGTKYLMTSADPFAVVNHPLQMWFLKTHILVTPLLVFALGLVTTRHIWRHLRNGVPWGRRSGITTGIVVIPMVVSGYLIQAVTHEKWLIVLAYGHIGVGVVFTLGAILHQLIASAAASAASEGVGTDRVRERKLSPSLPESLSRAVRAVLRFLDRPRVTLVRSDRLG